MEVNLSSAPFTGRGASTWLNPPAFQPAALSVLEQCSEDSIGKHCTWTRMRNHSLENNCFHLLMFIFQEKFSCIWALLCQNCHQHNERNQINIIQNNRPPPRCISSTGPKRTYCAASGKSYKTPRTPLCNRSQDFPRHTSELCTHFHVRSYSQSSFSSHLWHYSTSYSA